MFVWFQPLNPAAADSSSMLSQQAPAGLHRHPVCHDDHTNSASQPVMTISSLLTLAGAANAAAPATVVVQVVACVLHAAQMAAAAPLAPTANQECVLLECACSLLPARTG
jgi:hypothetical protein